MVVSTCVFGLSSENEVDGEPGEFFWFIFEASAGEALHTLSGYEIKA